jgi:hypothetical protein
MSRLRATDAPPGIKNEFRENTVIYLSTALINFSFKGGRTIIQKLWMRIGIPYCDYNNNCRTRIILTVV